MREIPPAGADTHASGLAARRDRRLFDRATEGILILDGATGKIVDVNPSLVTMVGYPPEALVGRRVWEAPSFRSLPDCKSLFDELTTSEAVSCQELSLQAADGRSIDVELIGDAYRLDDERLVQCSLRGLGDRRCAEVQMQASEQRFLTMANSMAQLAWIAQPDGYIYWYNQRWYDYTGTTADQMVGWGWQSVHDPAWVPHVLSKWTEATATS
jgi:hypothetical protein